MRISLALPLLLVLTFLTTLPSYASDSGSDLALVGAKIYLSPFEPPIENGTILVHDGHIASVGLVAKIKVPRGTTVIDCKGLVVTAGFWNSHVHILLPGLLHAENLSSGQITSQLQEMLTRWGFTTVFDIASVLKNTNLIRHRIESDDVKGPRILTVGEPFWVKGGTPIYVKGFLDANHISIPEVESAAQAKERVRQQGSPIGSNGNHVQECGCVASLRGFTATAQMHQNGWNYPFYFRGWGDGKGLGDLPGLVLLHFIPGGTRGHPIKEAIGRWSLGQQPVSTDQRQ